jgi:hypothetical protein
VLIGVSTIQSRSSMQFGFRPPNPEGLLFQWLAWRQENIERALVRGRTFCPSADNCVKQPQKSDFYGDSESRVCVSHKTGTNFAMIILTMPCSRPQHVDKVEPGNTWKFRYHRKSYTVMLGEVNFIRGNIKVRIAQTVD